MEDTGTIGLENVSVVYPGKEISALTSFSALFPPRSFTSVVGPSGSGKSTVLKVLAGLLAPSEGRIFHSGRISMVFQTGALLPWKSAEENVEIGLLNSGLSPHEQLAKARAALSEVGMLQLAREYPRDLSGGQRQRIGIARAIATNPDILLLDEPFSALDVETTRKLSVELVSLWQRRRLTVILVTHSPEEAVLLAQNVIIMKDGGFSKALSVPLPYPRHLETRVLHLSNEIRMHIHGRNE